MAVDRDGDLAQVFAALAPDVVVDASGPFQAYGGDPYRVVKAALAAGAHYLDLADGSEFVRNVAQLDAAAKAAGKFVLAGASSFPVLNTAVVRHLAADLKYVDSIAAGIAPSPYAGVGANVIRAIASYAGQPIDLRRAGRASTGYPFADTRRYTIAAPGYVPLAPLTFSLVDVPDLRLLAELWPEVQSVWIGAAPVPAILHRLLRWLAHGVRAKLIRTLTPLAPLMYRVTNIVRWGERRGGMFVEVAGRGADGAAVVRSWHLVAEGDDGPLIPSMAAEMLVRNLLDGRAPAPGARAALDELTLHAYERAFARWAIHCGVRSDAEARAELPLYQRILGPAWRELPPAVRELHASRATTVVIGRARVLGGANALARAVARAFGFPPAADDVDLRVTFERARGVEVWRREFASRRLTSVQYEGRGRFERLLCERFGPFEFGMALTVSGGRLGYVVRRWSFLGFPLPRRLAPRGESFESEAHGVFRFQVEVVVPLLGRIVGYSGSLRPR